MEERRSGPIPRCCDSEMVLLRSGRRAGVALWLWRCHVCERFEWTRHRYDHAMFWVGAMTVAIEAKRDELVADAYSPDVPPG